MGSGSSSGSNPVIQQSPQSATPRQQGNSPQVNPANQTKKTASPSVTSPSESRASGAQSKSPDANVSKSKGVHFNEEPSSRKPEERRQSSTQAPNLSHIMTREKTLIRESEQPSYTDGEEVVLEKYYHRNGAVYSCLYDNGQRYLLNPATGQVHKPFPQRWYKEGFIETEIVVQRKSGSGPSETLNNNDMSADSDRSGFLMHPKLGKLSTYVAEEKTNVHYYFDRSCGTWVRLPLSWELYSDFAKEKLNMIQEALPDWKEKYEILATLRSCRYDPDETISTFLNYTESDAKNYWKGSPTKTASNVNGADGQNKQQEDWQKEINDLREKLKLLQEQLAKEREDKEAANAMVVELQQRLQEVKTAVVPVASSDKNKTSEQLIKQLNTELLRQKYMEVRNETKKILKIVGGSILNVKTNVDVLSRNLKNQDTEVQDLRELYRKEALQRKLLYNKLQELRGNIRVICRCRYDKTECHYNFPSEREVAVPGRKTYKFDQVFRPESTQEQVFQEVLPIILSCVDGYNIAIIAYGQTGSGKTHTMQGSAKEPGINVRAIKELLKQCGEKENVDFTLTASLVEIYNESIYDLLTENSSPLEIRANGNKIVLPGAMEFIIGKWEDAEQLIALGDKNRTVAQTKMNSSSSRSHLIFRLKVEGKDRLSGSTSHGSLTLCDLAGSERVSRSEVKGEQLTEAAAINKSLSALGQVFTALKGNNLHIPYRNSKLTHMLQPCLGGDAKACMIVTMSPSKDNVTETVSTLEFGAGARQIQLGQAKAHVSKGADPMD